MVRIICFIAIILLPLAARGQQDALYSQYMFNPFAINPAYAGSRESISAVLLARRQWLNLPGAPSTQSLAVHGPFKGKNFALGFNAINESVGPVKNTGLFGTYAYQLRLSSGKLAFGLRAGMYSTFFNKQAEFFKDQTDPFAQSGSANKVQPSFDFGAYYYSQKYYVGLASTHLANGALSAKGSGYELKMEQRRHYMFTAGLAHPVSKMVVLKPSALVRYVNNAPLSIDLNMSALLAEIVWLGASFRINNALVLQAEVYITDFLRLGYSYDIDFSALKTLHSGSHEFMLGYELAKKSPKSPTKFF